MKKDSVLKIEFNGGGEIYIPEEKLPKVEKNMGEVMKYCIDGSVTKEKVESVFGYSITRVEVGQDGENGD